MQAQRIASSSLAGTSGCYIAFGGRVSARTLTRHHGDPVRPSLLQHAGRCRISATDSPITSSRSPAQSSSSDAPKPETEVEYAMRRVEERRATKLKEQLTYQVSAIASTLGVASLGVVATYLRFSWHLTQDGEFPWAEFSATLALVIGGIVGMEMWARYAHKALWHDYEPGWKLHKSHHLPRVGPFEDNDVFAIINAVPAMSLCAFGFFTPNMLGGVCFGAGLGITLFGIMYMFIHDGLVHNRFPVGPVAQVPYLQRVAMAHTMHHAAKWGGAPWGLFLGPQELEAIPGATEELDRLVMELQAKQQQQLLR